MVVATEVLTLTRSTPFTSHSLGSTVFAPTHSELPDTTYPPYDTALLSCLIVSNVRHIHRVGLVMEMTRGGHEESTFPPYCPLASGLRFCIGICLVYHACFHPGLWSPERSYFGVRRRFNAFFLFISLDTVGCFPGSSRRSSVCFTEGERE